MNRIATRLSFVSLSAIAFVGCKKADLAGKWTGDISCGDAGGVDAEYDIKAGSKVILTSNVFHQNKLAISMDGTVQQAIIQGNMFSSDKTSAMSLPPTVEKHPDQFSVQGNSFAAKS